MPRVILATFRNLLQKPREPELKKNNALLMIQRKVLKILSVAKLRSKNFGDPELLEDFEVSLFAIFTETLFIDTEELLYC